MTSETDRLRADIEDTRTEVKLDVNALTEKVDPRRIADRRMQSIRDTATGLRDQVMGTAEDATSSVTQAASDAVHAPMNKTRGNPWASGLVAFGIGWLLGSLIPVSERERELTDRAMEAAEPVRDEVKDVASQMSEGMAAPVKEAAEHLKESATEATSAVKESATRAADKVQSKVSTGRPADEGPMTTTF